jgi:DnaJ-class molecular chaperone
MLYVIHRLIYFRGDQIIKVIYKIPKNLTNKQKELLSEFDKEEDKKNNPGNGTSDTKINSTDTPKSNSSSSSTDTATASAWQRLKDFMGKTTK